jgi:hypothetical protein
MLPLSLSTTELHARAQDVRTGIILLLFFILSIVGRIIGLQNCSSIIMAECDKSTKRADYKLSTHTLGRGRSGRTCMMPVSWIRVIHSIPIPFVSRVQIVRNSARVRMMMNWMSGVADLRFPRFKSEKGKRRVGGAYKYDERKQGKKLERVIY